MGFKHILVIAVIVLATTFVLDRTPLSSFIWAS